MASTEPLPADADRPAEGALPLDLLRCPRTGARLRYRGSDALVSEEGGHVYPIVEGIPDFRLFDPPYVTRAQEAANVARLVEAAERLDFEGLVRFLDTEIHAHATPEARERAIAHRLTLPTRARTRFDRLLDYAGFDRARAGDRVLDLGCGSGEATAALAALAGGAAVGIDISLEELILARKLTGDAGITPLLVAGCAEALPFAEAAFSFVYSPDVIEHVSDQRAYLREIARVLRPGSATVLNSPNRYSVVCAEPHVGIWGLGFLPRAAMDPVCRALGKGPYIGKRLVSLPELRRLLAAAFPDFEIRSRESNPRATSLPGRLFHALSPWSVRAFAYVCDQHVVLARR